MYCNTTIVGMFYTILLQLFLRALHNTCIAIYCKYYWNLVIQKNKSNEIFMLRHADMLLKFTK